MSHDHSHMHGHDHGHSHGHLRGGGHGGTAGDSADAGVGSRRALRVALVLNTAFLVIELALGLYTGSLALLSDAAHMVGDVGALMLALGASQLAARAASPGRSYGWLRAETLGAFTNGLALVVACAFIIREAVERLLTESPEIQAWPVFVAGLVGLLINVGSALALLRADRNNLNIRGALLHMASDALGSLGAMVSAVFLWYGVGAADPIVSLFIAGLVLYGAVGLLRDSARVLLQFAPPGINELTLRDALMGAEGMADVHDIHVWTLDGQTVVLSAHLVPSPGVSARALRERAESLLTEHFRIAHTTLQVEGAGECLGPDCALWGRGAVSPARPMDTNRSPP